MGKVVFTSFPINGLDESQPQAAMLWEQLLSLKAPQWEPSRSQLGEVRQQVLSSMIGRKVAPWGIATGLAGGYLLLIVAAQVMFFGAARPRAFVASVGAALVLSGVLSRQADELRNAHKMKDEFLKIVSTQLKTPLTVIAGYADMFLERLLGTPEPSRSRTTAV